MNISAQYRRESDKDVRMLIALDERVKTVERVMRAIGYVTLLAGIGGLGALINMLIKVN